MTVQAGRGRRFGVLLIAVGLLALAAAPAAFGTDRLYWGNGGNNTIAYANLDGTGGGGTVNLAGATPGGPRGVAIDTSTGRIYWANQDSATISYANLDGSGHGGQLNLTGATITKPHGIAVDPAAGRLYWADTGGTISYANLDGSGGGDLDITGATPDAPYGVTIDPAAGRIYWANLGNNTIAYANLDGSGGGGLLDITGSTSGRAPRPGDRPRDGAHLLDQSDQHNLLCPRRRIGRRRRAQPHRGDGEGRRRPGGRPGHGEALVGEPRQQRESDLLRQRRRIGWRGAARHISGDQQPGPIPGPASCAKRHRRAAGLGQLDRRLRALVLAGLVGARRARLLLLPRAAEHRLPVDPRRRRYRRCDECLLHQLHPGRLPLPGDGDQRGRLDLADERPAPAPGSSRHEAHQGEDEFPSRQGDVQVHGDRSRLELRMQAQASRTSSPPSRTATPR